METPLFTATQFQSDSCDWREAIKLACQPLELKGIATPDYANAIITATEKNGPWYILTPEFALPHARPEEGVLSQVSHLSLLSSATAINFPDNPAVKLIIVLAAADSNQHILMMQKLVCWLDENERLHRLTNITNNAQLSQILAAR
ncbi:PTS sugar transporter subunit IIA [Pectobacterium sp. B1J-3]|uniref:PTS sugar transporter subunit IIA n=1 Tax=Pectobacterium sp. B1J-3 TaxID=3385371 RepID=UPI00390669A6